MSTEDLAGTVFEQAKRASWLGPISTPWDVIGSPFAIAQIVFNVVVSFGGPLFCFWLIFGSRGPYDWLSGEVLGPIVASPWACALCSLAFAPMQLPEMVEKGWFRTCPAEATARLARVFPFLGGAACWRRGVVRHLMLGTMVAALFIPAGLLIVRFGLAKDVDPDTPSELELAAWTQIWFSITYITLLPMVVMPLGLLAFGVAPNYERAKTVLTAGEPAHCFAKLLHRAKRAPQC